MRILVKFGGNAMDAGSEAALLDEFTELRAAGHAVILVHGGGPEIDRELARRGVRTDRIDGLRVTGEDALEAVEAVLCATNKRLVRACLQRGIAAAGVSGEDGALLVARRAYSPSGADLGYVGEIASVNPALLNALVDAGLLPVVSPIAVAQDGAHAYNVNADTAAGALAAALRADAYVAITNVERVRADPEDPASAIERMTLAQAADFAASPACAGGMKPKIRAAIDAVGNGAQRAYICGAAPQAVARALSGQATIIESAA
jgi:acetylglutamate kinase